MIDIPRRIILGPGPSSAHPKVLSAMSNSVIGYLDPDFFSACDPIPTTTDHDPSHNPKRTGFV